MQRNQPHYVRNIAGSQRRQASVINRPHDEFKIANRFDNDSVTFGNKSMIGSSRVLDARDQHHSDRLQIAHSHCLNANELVPAQRFRWPRILQDVLAARGKPKNPLMENETKDAEEQSDAAKVISDNGQHGEQADE
jgi:hypothetical protein